MTALEKLQAGVRIYNLDTGNGTSTLELIKTFEEVNGLKLNYEVVERRPGDIAECMLMFRRPLRRRGKRLGAMWPICAEMPVLLSKDKQRF